MISFIEIAEASEPGEKMTDPPRRFVVPDIHGCVRTFEHLVRQRIRLRSGDHLHLLGDYIDRGPHSKEVIDMIFSLKREGFNIHPLRGNHEHMFINACSNRDAQTLWLSNGGEATLASFGVREAAEIPMVYRNFFLSLPYFSALKEAILVHAGLNFEIPDPFADKDAMLWDRSIQVNPQALGGRKLICGHTPLSRTAIRQSIDTMKIMLDNGCVYMGNRDLGMLSALEIPGWRLHFQENVD